MKKDADWPRGRPENFHGNPHAYFEIKCECGAASYIAANNPRIVGRDPTFIIQSFGKIGWTKITTGKGVCPVCSDRKTPTKGPIAMASQQAKLEPARSPAALKALPELYMALGDYYDADLKLYKAGWSDERIAKELKLAPEFVAARRNSDFGPLVKPDPLKGIRASAEAARLIAQGITNVPISELATALIEFSQHMTGLVSLIAEAEAVK